MDDVISRRVAIDAVETIGHIATMPDSDKCVRRSAVKYTLSMLPSAQPEQRWIPCSERMPNTNGVYSVTRKISESFECRNISDACYYDGTNAWHDDTRVNHGRRYLTDVIAWMPLPEPYREGEPMSDLIERQAAIDAEDDK